MIRDGKFITTPDGHTELDHVNAIPDMYHSVAEFDEALAAVATKIMTEKWKLTSENISKFAKDMIDACPRRNEPCVADDLVFITDYVTEAIWEAVGCRPNAYGISKKPPEPLKLMIVTSEGILVETIEDLEQYDLSNAIARSEVIDQIQQAVKLHLNREAEKKKPGPSVEF